MVNDWMDSRTNPSLVLPLLMHGAVALGSRLAGERGVGLLTGGAGLVAAVIVGIAWFSRARAANRRDAVLDAYAKREIHRERRRKLIRSRRVALHGASREPEKDET